MSRSLDRILDVSGGGAAAWFGGRCGGGGAPACRQGVEVDALATKGATKPGKFTAIDGTVQAVERLVGCGKVESVKLLPEF